MREFSSEAVKLLITSEKSAQRDANTARWLQ